MLKYKTQPGKNQPVLPKRYLSGLLSNSTRCDQHQMHRHKQCLYRLLAARHASTGSANLPPGYIPDIPIAPMDDMKTVLPELNALGEPTLQSIGLAGNSPSGCVQQLLELIHVSLDMPWWGAIALGALAIRTVLFPVMIYQRRATINLRNHMPTITRLQQKINDAKTVGNQMELTKRSSELAEFMKRNDIKFRRLLIMPTVQVPVLLSVYQAIKSMSNLPVEVLKTGGISWFTDLTVADPYYILPASTALSILLMLELGAESQKTTDMSHAVKWMMRGMPVMVFLVTCKFSAGIAFYWSMNNLISLITVQFLKQPKVKKMFKLPDEVIHKKEVREKKGFMKGFTDMYDTSKLAAESNQRRHIDDMAFKKAGVGPVPKTYRYDPTKQKSKVTA
ncbi:mitochondrial inner membrane protein OXA1L-like isoform X2 [Mercenaria mercenaria]|uniref:mitochondrial inner membrane protein OXA1L-like isoform X2 n=1 Tax=Mercenaria mercenaria TaxID=6596 RepID=UPI00234F7413|nr:mitochondrial inner membrane protein OXA1L-like isoform X2 [Mercenaria mercenaria]